MSIKQDYTGKLKVILYYTTHSFLIISQLILAIVFIFSGFVKAIDPLGFTYKIQDYLNEFGGFFHNFSASALPLSIALSSFELLIGLCFLFSIKPHFTSILALLFMLVMTPLTLYIAIFNPVTDCGCFGDALIITNWQTFYKNIILLILIIIPLIINKKARSILLPHIEWFSILIFIFIGVAVSIYSLKHLPLIDFLPYKIEVNIPNAMTIPDGEAIDKYETTFIYQKDGVEKEFTLENYPKGDSTWSFVDQKTKLLTKGYEPPIHNFSIVDATETDITEEITYYEGNTFLVVMYDVNKTSIEGIKRAEKWYQKYKHTTTKFYALTASSNDEVSEFVSKTDITFPICKTDPITLKTIIRANPGLLLIKNGIIKGKWNWRDF